MNRLLSLLLVVAAFFSASAAEKTYKITAMTTSSIKIDGKELRKGDSFGWPAHIDWVDNKQSMEIMDIKTGKLYRFSKKVFDNKDHAKSLRDYFLSTSTASTRGDGKMPTWTESPVKNQFGEKRIALVMGNSNYNSLGYLRNAQKDAADVGGVLSELGFDLLESYETNYDDMKLALNKFANMASGYDVALFYFAGHGLQDDGRNYLVPIDAALEMKSELQRCLNASDVMQRMDAAGTPSRIVVLDACRNSKQSWSRSTEAGLARMEGGAGSVIIFSTESGKVALDGEGSNSPFAEALMSNLVRPRVSASRVFPDIANDTYDYTGQLQFPLVVGTLRGAFSFNSAARKIQVDIAGSDIRPTAMPQSAPVQKSEPAPQAPVETPRAEYADPTVDYDGDVDVQFAGCRRSGSNVYVTFYVTNTGRKDLAWCVNSINVIDDEGTEYNGAIAKGNSDDYKGYVEGLLLPVGVRTKLTMKVKDVPASAASLAVVYFNLFRPYATLTIRGIPLAAKTGARQAGVSSAENTSLSPEVDFDSELAVNVVRCNRSGANVYVTFYVSNLGRKDIVWHVNSVRVVDNDGTDYSGALAKGDGDDFSGYISSMLFPAGQRIKLRMKAKDFSRDATSLAAVYVNLYNPDNVLTIRNIPVGLMTDEGRSERNKENVKKAARVAGGILGGFLNK